MLIETIEHTTQELETTKDIGQEFWQDFVKYFQTPADEKPRNATIGFDRMLFDLVGNINAAIVLHEIVFWFTPTKSGKPHKSGGIQRDGKWWIARSYEDWWETKRLTPKQAKNALKKLKDLGFITLQTMKSRYHNNNTTVCIHLECGVFGSAWDKLPKPDMPKSSTEKSPKGSSGSAQKAIPDSPKGTVPINRSDDQREQAQFTDNPSVSLESSSTDDETENTHNKTVESNQEKSVLSQQNSEAATEQPKPDEVKTEQPAMTTASTRTREKSDSVVQDNTKSLTQTPTVQVKVAQDTIATASPPPSSAPPPPQQSDAATQDNAEQNAMATSQTTQEETDEIEIMSKALRAYTATKWKKRTPELYSAGRKLLLRGFTPNDIEALELYIRQRMFSYKEATADPLTIDQLIGYVETHDHRPGKSVNPEQDKMLDDLGL